MKKTLLLGLSLLALSGCGNNDESNAIYCSCYPVFELVSRIAGEDFKVINLTPPGAEPHDYELTPRQLAGMSSAQAIFINGLGLEPWASSLPNSVSSKVVDLSMNVKTLQIDGIIDPHIWLSPTNAIKEMNDIFSHLSTLEGANTSVMKERYNAEVAAFHDLDERLMSLREKFDNENFVVSHASFGYLADQYGLNQIYVSGISPSQEPSAKEMEDIIAKVNDFNINTIFTEELISPKIAEAIARQTNCKLETLDPLEGIEENETKNYISVMEQNFSKLLEASK